MMKRRSAAALVALIISVVLAVPGASAHQPVNLNERDNTPARGPLLVDGTVSFAIRADLSRGDRRGFRFQLNERDTLALQLLIVDEVPANRLRTLALPRVTVTDPLGNVTYMVIDERTKFYEPYGGTNYLYLSRVEKPAIAGIYKVRMTGRHSDSVETVVSVGYREVRGEVRD
jgi:hypothetical protein